jgi:ADP-ribose pyrophosphatase YjhB (NUDIX family)
MAPSPVSYRFCPACGGALAARVVKPGDPPRLVCAVCGFVFYQSPKLAAGAIAALDGRLVLARRAIEPAHGLWVFPGGFVDRGETVEAAAAREALEEVNLAVEIGELVGVYSYPGNEVVVVVYAAHVVGGELRAADECLEVATFAPQDVPWDALAFPSTRAALEDYLAQFGSRLPAG